MTHQTYNTIKDTMNGNVFMRLPVTHIDGTVFKQNTLCDVGTAGFFQKTHTVCFEEDHITRETIYTHYPPGHSSYTVANSKTTKPAFLRYMEDTFLTCEKDQLPIQVTNKTAADYAPLDYNQSDNLMRQFMQSAMIMLKGLDAIPDSNIGLLREFISTGSEPTLS